MAVVVSADTCRYCRYPTILSSQFSSLLISYSGSYYRSINLLGSYGSCHSLCSYSCWEKGEGRVKENNDRKNPTDRQTGNKSLTESHYLGPIIDARGRDSAPFHLAIQKDQGWWAGEREWKRKTSFDWKSEQFNEHLSIQARWYFLWRRHTQNGTVIAPPLDSIGKPFVDWFDGRWVEIRSTGMMMTSQADSRIKGGKKDPSSFSRSCFSLFIHCNSIVVDRWLIVSRCRPSRTQHGPSQPDNQIISRIKNGDRS